MLVSRTFWLSVAGIFAVLLMVDYIAPNGEDLVFQYLFSIILTSIIHCLLLYLHSAIWPMHRACGRMMSINTGSVLWCGADGRAIYVPK